MEQDIIEAECQIAYEDEGARLRLAPTPLAFIPYPYKQQTVQEATLRKRSFKPFYRKIGGLHFISIGRLSLSFSIRSNASRAQHRKG